LRIDDPPDGMPDAIVRRKVGNRRSLAGGGNQLLCLVAVRMSQQDRPGLGVQCLDLADAVVLLVGAGEFMLANAVVIVVLDRGCGDQPGLRVRAHDQTVGVVASLLVPYEDASIDQTFEILGRFGVNLGCIVVNALRQINLGLRNMQEGKGLAGSAKAGLVTGKNVVGRCGYRSSVFAARTQTGEGADQRLGGSQLRLLEG
jgi:hypothetical protein